VPLPRWGVVFQASNRGITIMTFEVRKDSAGTGGTRYLRPRDNAANAGVRSTTVDESPSGREAIRQADIEMFFDFACPWCYITKRRVEAAVRALPADVKADVFWRPFPLGMESRPHASLTAIGAAEGIEFAFDRIVGRPDTMDAHRLVWLAERHGVPTRVVADLVDGIYRAHLSEGRDIGSRSALVAIAAEVGIGAQRVEQWLAGQNGVNEVRALRRRASKLGIDMVPFLLINGAVGVRGSRSVTHLLENIAGASWFRLRPARPAA
jgi:predicted DsbA family dithiol-disulfide isomerase